ncbi:MAG TPA: isopentenyl transferase family protein, partial [Candidatus Saccharimonadales bacterium]|nr:isopentenyl transferase family protein [Candidatus Saccharimonadales bacterium]
MATRFVDIPLVVIVGPTASGKTGLAIELAKQHRGEIICADSRSIYKGANIGTAKPSKAERANVPHWGLDLVNPGEYFSVADFKEYANKKISEIRSRGNVPFLVGGTGL